jgi:hypothetical protein
VWANEEQTISAHIEPALDDFVSVLTTSYLRTAVPDTLLVIGYDTATLRLRQDRSKEAIELHDRGLLNAKVTVREVGFDPENDMMDDTEFKRWILTQLAKGAASPEMVQAAIQLLTNVDLPVAEAPESTAPELPGSARRSLEQHPYQGPPRVDHEHNDAPFSALAASCEALVLRALEKSGNRLLNDGKRGRDRDRTTPPHMAHLTASANKTFTAGDFDFSLAQTLLSDLNVLEQTALVSALGAFCADLYNEGAGYTRDALVTAMGARI